MEKTKDLFNYQPGDLAPKEKLHEMLRVNHAGEYGAVKIYEGQLSILKDNRKISSMLDQEKKHLEYFNQKLLEEKVRPSALSLLWSVGGYLLGKLTALAGEKAAMACTEAVEEVISKHYQNQLNTLGNHYPELSEKIKIFREEEIEHQKEAIESGSKNTLGYEILTSLIKTTSRLAIKIAEKI